MFLLAVWLFSRSGAILAIFFISEFPLLKREQGRTLPIWTARRTKPKIPGLNIPTAKIPPQNPTTKVKLSFQLSSHAIASLRATPGGSLFPR